MPSRGGDAHRTPLVDPAATLLPHCHDRAVQSVAGSWGLLSVSLDRVKCRCPVPGKAPKKQRSAGTARHVDVHTVESVRAVSHPLQNDAVSDPTVVNPTAASFPMSCPQDQVRVKTLNLGELDLTDHVWDTARDLVPGKPIYTLHRKSKQCDQRSPSLHRKQDEAPPDHKWQELTATRTRQRSAAPNFLKLFALENSARRKHLLPEVPFDDDEEDNIFLLGHDTTAQSPQLYENDIAGDRRLGIVTAHKLWGQFAQGQLRSDVYGTACPCNLQFVRQKPAIDQGNSHGVPQSLLDPCGTLQLGKDHDRTVQYLVKGFCDARFVSSDPAIYE
ncbi:Gis3p KNAG_0G02090 [Huiozyma naganishii CBS 8797]|uniref:Uncharacterized protein n=1 Tax=Huiozyma naganishii (strain ATCC MYA-139 / BCRC 22969 / CBS 8797 / KCTC 17520 / NBRC 10181 / NCYC 3082 / Yp74L-3) TaxID=1071383 RepID=J7S930_HUIN7|nr:hypothetical protein KNAG_0G02090 [Kazachstania naganishii CBS 8797]CCK71266.1 hypothetical protein KNAG_0G02090 [Kazachstania naganishii CBS 8797]